MRTGRDQDSSPEPNRFPAPSPTDVCPVFANLSPLKPEKAEPYRFTGTNYPSPRQLFTSSPHSEQHQETNLRRNGHQHCDNHVNNRQQDDGTRALSALKQVKPLCSHKLDETTGDQKINQRAGVQSAPKGNIGFSSVILNGIEYDVGNLDRIGPSSNTYINCRPQSNKLQSRFPSEFNKTVDASEDHSMSSRSVDDAMDTNKECGIRRRLNFETENDSIGRCNSHDYMPALPPTSTRFGETPKRKRKRVSVSKQCNCKRSKCLKLYCECFASGIYCLDSCACTNCFNKPDYEDTVHDARQQIEARNPHAFAPKVVNHSPRNAQQDMNWTSARHKRGCNCKKSKCLKKYCECYQSKVGCSDGCRCDDCQNSFGTRPETGYGRIGRWKNEAHEKIGTGQTYTDDSTSFVPSAPEVAVYSSLWNYGEASQSQFGTRFQADGSFHYPYPLNVCTQRLHTSHEDITKDENIPSDTYTSF